MAMVATPTRQEPIGDEYTTNLTAKNRIPATAVSIWKEWSITAVAFGERDIQCDANL